MAELFEFVIVDDIQERLIQDQQYLLPTQMQELNKKDKLKALEIINELITEQQKQQLATLIDLQAGIYLQQIEKHLPSICNDDKYKKVITALKSTFQIKQHIDEDPNVELGVEVKLDTSQIFHQKQQQIPKSNSVQIAQEIVQVKDLQLKMNFEQNSDEIKNKPSGQTSVLKSGQLVLIASDENETIQEVDLITSAHQILLQIITSSFNSSTRIYPLQPLTQYKKINEPFYNEKIDDINKQDNVFYTLRSQNDLDHNRWELILIIISTSEIKNVTFCSKQKNVKKQPRVTNFQGKYIHYFYDNIFMNFITDYQIKFKQSYYLKKDETHRFKLKDFISMYRGKSVAIYSSLDQEQHSSLIHNYSILFSINFLVKNQFVNKQPTIPDLFKWLKLLTDQYDRSIYPNRQKTLFMSKILLQGYEVSQWYFYFFYGIFGAKQAYKTLDKYAIIKNMELKNITIKKWQKSQHFSQMQLLYYQYLLYNKMSSNNINLQLTDTIFKNNMSFQNEQVIKRMIMKVSILTPKVMARCREVVDKYLVKSKQITAYDYLLLKTRYLALSFQFSQMMSNQMNAYVRNKQMELQNYIIITFIAQLTDKCTILQIKQDKSDVMVNKQGLKGIFLRTTTWKDELRVTDSKFCDFYMQLKRLLNANAKIGQTIFNCLEAKLENHYPIMLEKYSANLSIIMFMNPILSSEEDALDNYFQDHSFTNGEVGLLIEYYIQHAHHISQNRFYDNLIKIMRKKDRKFQFYSIFKKANQISNTVNSPHKPIFIKIFRAFLDNLAISISEPVVKKYLNSALTLIDQELRLQYSKKICAEIRRQVRYDEHFYNIINKSFTRGETDKKDYFISIYFENQNSVIQEVQQKLWECLTRKIQYLHSISTRFKMTFQLSAKRLMAKIQENKLTSEELNALNFNLNHISYYMQREFILSIQRSYARKQEFHEKLKLIQYILGKCQNLSELGSYFIRRQMDMKDKNLQTIYLPQIGDEETQMFKNCHELRILMSYELSSISKALTIQQFKSQFEKQKAQLLKILQKYYISKLNYLELQQYFPINIVADVCHTFCKQKQVGIKIIRCASKMHIKNIINLEEYVHSYLNIIKCLKSSTDTSNYDLFLQIISNIKNEPGNVLVTQSIQLIQLIQNQIGEVYHIKTDVNNPLSLLQQLQNNQISRIVKSTYRGMALFDKIQQRNIDQRSIGDLKEYINDQQNSSLRLDSIKQLEHVLQYWTTLKRSKSIQQFINNLEKKIEASHEDIWLHIDNCFSIYRLIDQKLEEAANRETSFKYQIQAIFQNSTLSIKMKNDCVELEVITAPLLTGASFINRELVIQYKRLQNFKDKSILLISDIERQQNQDPNIQRTLSIFKRFQEYFSIIQSINHIVNQLINYGYNPVFIISEIKVEKNDFRKLIQKLERLQKMCNQWVKGIKQLYKQSYILTHFIGSQLSIFINRCLNNQYHHSLYSILKLSKAEFHQKTNQKDFKQSIELALKSQPLKQTTIIAKTYLIFQDKIRSNVIKGQNNQIFIDSVAQKYFYCCLLQSNNKIAESNRVFYCLQSTKAQQIQVFLWRALIDSSRTYYFIGAHSLKQQIKLYFWNQLLYLLQQHKNDSAKINLIFIDNIIADKFYSFIIKSKLFNAAKRQYFETDLEKKTKDMIDILPSTWIVESAKAGLGKTYQIQQLSKLQNKKVRFFPISGNTEFSKLARRLKNLNINQNECLSISLFQVQDWKKIEVFLSEIILFRTFYFEEFIFLPQDLWIFIQIQNVFHGRSQQTYPLLNLLIRYGQGIYIKQFENHMISIDEINDQEKFVLLYMDLLDKPNAIATKQLYFVESPLYPIPENAHELIDKYFSSWFKDKLQKPTFTCYKCFMKMLFKSFKAFSECEYLKIEHIVVADAQFQYLQFSKFRQNFLMICIANVLQFLEESYTSNDFSSNTEYETFHHRMNNINMLILPSTKIGNYQFVYTSDEKVPLCIKSLLLTQNPLFFKQIYTLKNKQDINQLFSKTSLNHLDQYFLQQKLQHILMSIADQVLDQALPEQIKRLYYPNFDEYKLTLDNFIKICLIWHRASSGIPCILMGQSGVGKTKLISFFVQEVLKNVLKVINLHAGIHEDELIQQISQVRKTAEDWGVHNRIWLFFDQFNTCDELGYIKQMVIDHRFMGEPLPANLIIVAACNPYRKKHNRRLIKAGIRRQIQNQNELAFTVKAPPMSMVQLMWDYQQLREKELSIYIEKMLQKINYRKKAELIDVIMRTHEFLNINIEISSASLRDVARFKKIYQWFYKFMPKQGEGNTDRRYKNNYNMDRSERCVILTYSFCYCLRLATSQEREKLYQMVEAKLSFPVGWVKKVVMNEQIDYVRRLKVSDEQIALNTALIENVFTCLVCLLNKIPVLLIGNPGSSKSLSMRLIQSNMRGSGSQSVFCREFPELNVLYFQGSESSTSKGVQQIFEKALRWKNQLNKKLKIEQCILFDQIGLAEKSVHNPLKVLHSKLQTSSEQICFIGISNWELDLAKMSRFLVLARSTPDEKDLSETAYQIAQSYLGNYEHNQYIGYQITRSKWESLGQHYFRFINRWEKDPMNKKNFFGLRDFYGYVKFICSQVIKEKGQMGAFQRAIDKSIEINFDGQEGSVELFKKIVESDTEDRMNPLKLIEFNLERNQSRCLLLIIRGDSLVPLINKGIDLGDADRKIICIHGSTFSIDQESEQYNQQMTALTINHISRGNVLAFKDINNSIQTSLYDLFNKSFTKVGAKRYCRIAVGANSNPKCLVHYNFNAIVYIEQSRLELLDPPFLNRFEKHYFNIKNMITKEELQLLDQTNKWVQQMLSFRSRQSILRNQQFLLNSSEQAIITLIIKHRNTQRQFENVQKDLLSNKTTDFIIAMQGNQVLKYQNEKEGLRFSQNQDYIVWTYDELINITEFSIFQEGSIIHIQEINSEKQLRKQLKKQLLSEKRNLQIYLNYQNHRQHLSFILILIDQLKTSLDAKKQVFVVIQMHRFSLHHLKIDHVNLSYLHPFQQIFAETLNTQKQDQLNYILQKKKYFETYNILKMREEFSTHFTQTIKCCKFISSKQKKNNLNRLHFEQCILLKSNNYFIQSCLASIQAIFKQKQIELKILQENNDSIISCSNILQAIERHIQHKVKQIIYEHLKVIVEKGLLFHFNQTTTRHIKLSHGFQQGYNYNQNFLNSLSQQEFKRSIEPILSKEHFNFKIGVEQNLLIICEQVYLLPMAVNECNFIFSEGSESISQYTRKISLQYSSKEDLIDIVRQQKDLITLKSQAYKIYQASQIVQKQCIQKYLIFDLLTYFLANRNRNKYHIQKLTIYLLIFFTAYQFQEKIVLIAFDKTITLHLLDLLQSISLNDNIAGAILNSVQFSMKDAQIDLSIIKFIQRIIEETLQHLYPTQALLQQFSTIKHFCQYFSSMHKNILAFYVSFNTFGQKFIEKAQLINQFLIFLSQFDEKFTTLAIHGFEKEQKKKARSTCQSIFLVMQDMLVNVKQNSVKQKMVAFLCNQIFYVWIKEKKAMNKPTLYSKSLTKYFELIDQYYSIANKSASIFELIFSFNNKFESLKDCLQEIKNRRIDQLQIKIDFKNNLSVALGFYYSKILKDAQSAQFANTLQNQNINNLMIHEYLETFKLAIEKFNDDDTSNQKKISLLQFCKIYCLNYLAELNEAKNQQDILQEIDSLLCKSDELTRHLRLFMTKNLTSKYGQLFKVRRYFIEMKRCNWIFHLKDLLEDEHTEIILPIIPQNKPFQQMIQTFKKSNFTNLECFHDIILHGLQDSQKTYLMLNFFFTTFYMRNCPEQYIKLLITQVEERQDLKQRENILVKRILIMYLQHKITNKVEFDAKNTDNSLHIVLLNYLNVIISCRKMRSQFSEMFFTEEGIIPQDYAGWLKERYLIGSVQNPSAERIRYLLNKFAGDAGQSYYIMCTEPACGYITPIGGFFYGEEESVGCGALDPGAYFKCNLCGKASRILQDNTYEGKILDHKSIITEKDAIEMFEKVSYLRNDQTFEHSLRGYKLGSELKDIRRIIDLKAHFFRIITDYMQHQSQFISFKVMQSIIYFVWLIFAQTHMLEDEQFELIFQKNTRNSSQFLIQASRELLKFANSSIGLKQRDQMMIWHFTFAKRLFDKMETSAPKLSLTQYSHKQKFEGQIEQIMKQLCGIHKQKIILENRKSLIISKSQILRQYGNVELHQQQYSLIKLFKVLNTANGSVSKLDTLKLSKYQILSKEFPFLSFMLNFKQKSKMQHIYNILLFISKLNALNLKITRTDSNIRIVNIVEQYLSGNESEKEQNLKLMRQCIRSWNQLAKNKYKLKDGCTTIGILQKIDQKMPIKYLIADRNNPQNLQGKRVLEFIITMANQYNQTCEMMESLASKTSHHFMSQFKMNPSSFKGLDYLKLPFQLFQESLTIYSHYSIQYGLKQLQYEFEKIQSLIIKRINGCKYFITNKDEFEYVKFIGEDNSFMIFMKEDSQLKFSIQLQQKLQEYFTKQQNYRGETFYKFLKEMIGSLQNLIVCFKNKRNQKISTIGQFINEFKVILKIKNFTKELSEDPLQSLSVNYLGALYEMLQQITFSYNLQLLNPIFCEPLKNQQIRVIKPVLLRMKNQSNLNGLPSLSSFKCVIQRFITRIIMLSNSDKSFINNYVCEISWLWPKGQDVETFNKSIRELLEGIETTKACSLLKLIQKLQIQSERIEEPEIDVPKLETAKKEIKPLKKLATAVNKNKRKHQNLD